MDAICINQDDLAERSAEVLEMGSIYSRAEQVVVWVGPSSKDSRLALETLKRRGDGIRYHVEGHTISNEMGSWAVRLEGDSEALKFNQPSWFAIRDLLRRQWFSRLWVFQEIGLATKATLFAGQDGIDWILFITALQWLWGRLEHLNQVFHDLNFEAFNKSGISGLLNVSFKSYPRELDTFGLLELTSRLNSSDPRDRLYALRSLVVPTERKFITPDYSKSVEEAFKNFTVRFCRETGDGFLLTRCSLRDVSSKLQMPSWVPDFSATNLPGVFYTFSASGYSRFSAVLNNDSLTVQGVKLATITSLLDPFKPSYTNFEIIQVLRSWEISCRSSMYPSGGSTSDAFIHAIVGGKLTEFIPTETQSALSLEQCRRILDPGEAGVEIEDINYIKAHFVMYVRASLHGRVFFKTREGFLGICPESAKDGDLMVVFPGVYAPLALRPVTHQGQLSYRIVGASYVHGAMHAEVLLGSIPVGWNYSYKMVNGEFSRLVFARGDILTQKDPRLPLPPEWRYRYLSGKRFQDPELDSSMNFLPQGFENVKTKESSWFDPRLTPDALRERGIDLQEFVLA
jgi:hypothetical protein